MKKPCLPPEQRRSRPVPIRLTESEKEAIQEAAERAGLSVSEFARRALLGRHIPSLEDHRARLELLRVNGDLGRMEGLLKQARSICCKEQIDRMLKKFEEARELIETKIKNI